jgi:hypothetical protein
VLLSPSPLFDRIGWVSELRVALDEPPILACMRPHFLLATHAQRYVTHNTLGHSASNTNWTAVLVGLIPILGLAAIGILIYAFVRKGPDAPDD